MLSVQVPTVGREVGVLDGKAEGVFVGDSVGSAVGAGVWPTVTQPCSAAHLAHSLTSDKKSLQQFLRPSSTCEVENIDKSDPLLCC